MDRRFAARIVLAFVLLLCAAQPSARQPGAAPTREQIAHFLATAKIVGDKEIPIGVTRPLRLTLDNGELRHDAAFSTVEQRVPVMRFEGGRTEIDFIDSYRYSLAAYAVAELVGLDEMMPVTVERQYHGRRGALSWWVDVQMDEAERRAKSIKPPDPEAWSDQMHRMKVFTQLVGDTDRNLGNLLVGRDWKLWMIDFTRAFRRTRELRNPADLNRCDRQLLARMRALTKNQLAEKTHDYLGGGEIDALLARRDLIVARFDQLIAERGEARVLY
jgi:hypothetical protein